MQFFLVSSSSGRLSHLALATSIPVAEVVKLTPSGRSTIHSLDAKPPVGAIITLRGEPDVLTAKCQLPHATPPTLNADGATQGMDPLSDF
ncbi:hypothetical protein PSHT_16352 [Puccinia striiformis]|uniref:Uncharacterized protein n=1 Tax=Puccinia striiformis TaxID=27350 RepID=A0A2S4UAG5_9BASI|nr:hypothetical protein PSHT_16352 [Puccinia striiformis]